MIATLMKQADIGGGGDDSSFEQAFSNIAHTALKDKAGKLVQSELGFQLVDRNEDNTKAIAIAGYQVGDQLLYVPVFFLNGKIKGTELLYIKAQDMFVPLKEKWVDYILNLKPNILGKGVDKNLQRMGVLPPNLYQISRSPNKYASVNQWPDWMQAVAPDIGHFITTNPLNDKKYEGITDLPSFLKQAGKDVLVSLIRTMQDEPRLIKWLDNFHGLPVIDEAIKEASIRNAADVSILQAVAIKQAAMAGKDVHVVTDKQTLPAGKGVDLTDKERETLVSEKVVIKDTRKDDDVTVAFRVKPKIQLYNPDASGMYNVLVRPGHFEECLVITKPHTQRGRKPFCTLIRLDGKKAWLNTHPTNVFAHVQFDDKKYDEWYNGLPDADSIPKSGVFVILNKRGEGTVPFEVEKVIGSEDGKKTYEVFFHSYSCNSRAGLLPQVMPRRYGGRDDVLDFGANQGSHIVLTNKEGARILAQAGSLFVPKGFKLLRVDSDTDSDKDDKDNDSPSNTGSGSQSHAIELGDMATAQLLLLDKLAHIDIRHSGSVVWLNDQEKEPLDALVDLVQTHGLREKQARVMLDEAKERKYQRYFLKYAAPYEMQTSGPSAPPFPEPHVGADPMTGYQIPTQQNSSFNVPVPSMSSGLTDRSIYDPTRVDQKYPNTFANSMQTAQDAAATGQKEVFDTAMVGSLLKATRSDSMVDRYLGDIMKGMDRIGRILFTFYWHQDAFEERYGKGDIPELEDGLRNAFEAVGDIVLFLKQKSVDAHPDAGGHIDLDALASS